jgi:hypothetical protein
MIVDKTEIDSKIVFRLKILNMKHIIRVKIDYS